MKNINPYSPHARREKLEQNFWFNQLAEHRKHYYLQPELRFCREDYKSKPFRQYAAGPSDRH
jgi:hypothetical protein